MDSLTSIFDNAMNNMNRITSGYADSDTQWGYILAILGAVVVGWAVISFMRKNNTRNDDDR